MSLTLPRRLWTVLEPIHAVTYFAAEARAAFEDAGYRGFWRGYFAGRAAPLGPVGAEPVIATFYGFAPRMVARALPGVWELGGPATALEVRRAGAIAVLSEVFAAASVPADDAALRGVITALRRAVDDADVGGRPLGAANAALPWPREPVAALWHAATVLRELRGDGHVAALLTAEVTGLEALVLRAGKDVERGIVQPARGWTDEEWQVAASGLQSRGLLDGHHRLTSQGAALLEGVETVTDRLAAQPWRGLRTSVVTDLVERLTPLARAAFVVLPERNPIGLRRTS
jgi:hypothetical protein